MISASKMTFSPYSFKILRPKVTKILRVCLKNFCEFPPKELCSLASDINPELVYQFMHLANNNAIWQSRLGGAFGFSSIAAKAGEQLEPYLPKILPKLYRYQFDPVTKIQVSMTSIWNALVQDNTKTVDLYLPHIMDELQKNLTNNQWRVREACCGGLQVITIVLICIFNKDTKFFSPNFNFHASKKNSTNTKLVGVFNKLQKDKILCQELVCLNNN